MAPLPRGLWSMSRMRHPLLDAALGVSDGSTDPLPVKEGLREVQTVCSSQNAWHCQALRTGSGDMSVTPLKFPNDQQP
jgi:hypothetical protein